MGFWKGLGDSSIFTIQLHFDFWCPYPRVTGATSLASLAAPEAFSTLRSLRGSSYGSHEFVERTGTAAILQGTLVSVLPGGVGNQKFLVAAKNPKKKSENQFFGFASWRPAFLHFSLHTSYIAQFVYRNCTRNVHYKKDMIIHVFFVYICVA